MVVVIVEVDGAGRSPPVRLEVSAVVRTTVVSGYVSRNETIPDSAWHVAIVTTVDVAVSKQLAPAMPSLTHVYPLNKQCSSAVRNASSTQAQEATRSIEIDIRRAATYCSLPLLQLVLHWPLGAAVGSRFARTGMPLRTGDAGRIEAPSAERRRWVRSTCCCWWPALSCVNLRSQRSFISWMTWN